MRVTDLGPEPAIEDLRDALVEDTSTPAIEVNPASARVQGANEAFVDASGWSRWHLLGSVYLVCFHPKDWPIVTGMIERLGAGRPVDPRSLRLVRSDGRWCRRTWSGVPRLDPDSETPIVLACRCDPGLKAIPPSAESRGGTPRRDAHADHHADGPGTGR